MWIFWAMIVRGGASMDIGTAWAILVAISGGIIVAIAVVDLLMHLGVWFAIPKESVQMIGPDGRLVRNFPPSEFPPLEIRVDSGTLNTQTELNFDKLEWVLVVDSGTLNTQFGSPWGTVTFKPKRD